MLLAGEFIVLAVGGFVDNASERVVVGVIIFGERPTPDVVTVTQALFIEFAVLISQKKFFKRQPATKFDDQTDSHVISVLWVFCVESSYHFDNGERIRNPFYFNASFRIGPVLVYEAAALVVEAFSIVEASMPSQFGDVKTGRQNAR